MPEQEEYGEDRTAPGGLIGLAIQLSEKAGKSGDPKAVKKIQKIMENVRETPPPTASEHEKAAFFHAFIDELLKLKKQSE